MSSINFNFAGDLIDHNTEEYKEKTTHKVKELNDKINEFRDIVKKDNDDINFIAMAVNSYSKNPFKEGWQHTTKSHKFNKMSNVALLTGIDAGFFVVDYDLYEKNFSIEGKEKFFNKEKNSKKGITEEKFNKYKNIRDEYESIFNNTGNINDMINEFNTLTIKSPSGGYHFYFLYDPIKNIPHGQHPSGIDIRNNGGCIMAPPSYFENSDKYKNGRYEVYKNTSIKVIPDKLYEWLYNNIVHKNKKDDKNDKPKKNKKKTLLNNEDGEDDYYNNITTVYDITISKEQIKEILNLLWLNRCKDIKDPSDNYCINSNKWKIALSAIRFAGDYYNEFDEFSKRVKEFKGYEHLYNPERNKQKWNDDRGDNVEAFYTLLRVINVKDVYTYKRAPKPHFNNYTEKKITYLKHTDYECNRNYLIKSPPKTGKTTSVKTYFKHLTKEYNDNNKDDANYEKNKPRLLLIASRIILCEDLAKSFAEDEKDEDGNIICEGVIVDLYNDEDFMAGYNNICITPDSIHKISSINFKNTIVFIDEFESCIRHLLNSTTLNRNRLEVFKTLTKIMLTCKQFFCVDGDISSTSKGYLDILKLKYEFIINVTKAFNNKPVEIIKTESELIEKMKIPNAICCVSDSKTVAENNAEKVQSEIRIVENPETETCEIIIKRLLKENNKFKDMVLLTSDTMAKLKKNLNLTLLLAWMCSPAILYGLNDLLEGRHVFTHYRGHTINPPNMVQQISRARNLEKVYLYYENIGSRRARYKSLEDCAEKHNIKLMNYKNEMDILLKESYGEYDNNGNIVYDNKQSQITIENIFNELYIMDRYTEDCYNTNKYYHLLDILKERGFIIENPEVINNDNVKDMKAINEIIKQNILDNKRASFNIDDEKNKRLNEYLKIKKNDVDAFERYKDIFIIPGKFEDHLYISKYIFNDNASKILYQKLADRKDFDIKKEEAKKTIDKLAVIDDLFKYIGMEDKDISFNKYTDKEIKLRLGKEIPKEESEIIYDSLLKHYVEMMKKRYKKEDQIKMIDTKHKQEYYKTVYDVYQEIVALLNVMFKGLVKKNKKDKKDKEDNEDKEDKEDKRIINVGKKKCSIYNYDENFYNYHKDLFTMRKIEIKEGDNTHDELHEAILNKSLKKLF